MTTLWQKEQLEFMKACGQTTFKLGDWIRQKSKEDRKEMLKAIQLYGRLIEEEINNELSPALGGLVEALKISQGVDTDYLIPSNADELATIFDGCIDGIYVILGLMNVMGFPSIEGWDEVQKSNMAKRMADGKVYKREDGKILKPDDWKKPNLIGVLGDQLVREQSETEPWQASIAQTLIRFNSLTRNTEKIDMAIKDKNLKELIDLGNKLTDLKLEFNTAIQKAIDSGIK